MLCFFSIRKLQYNNSWAFIAQLATWQASCRSRPHRPSGAYLRRWNVWLAPSERPELQPSRPVLTPLEKSHSPNSTGVGGFGDRVESQRRGKKRTAKGTFEADVKDWNVVRRKWRERSLRCLHFWYMFMRHAESQGESRTLEKDQNSRYSFI